MLSRDFPVFCAGRTTALAAALALCASPALSANTGAGAAATATAESLKLELASPAASPGTPSPSQALHSPAPPPGITVTAPSPSAPPALAVDPSLLQDQAEDVAARAAAEERRRNEEHNRESFNRASNGLLPLSPDQVKEFMRRLESTQEAAAPPSSGAPKGEVRVVALSMDPGSQPPKINLSAGYVTTIDMVDVTGEPWPILDVGVGGNFEVTPTQAGSHVVRVVPLTRVGDGNLSVLLKNLPTPVIFRLSAGEDSFHMRYDVRVPKMGPNAKVPLIERGRGPVAGDHVIVAFLENTPPRGAKRLKVTGLDSRTMAWQLDDRVYVRTPITLLSPAWNASVSSADGMTVYEIGDAPVLLMSDEGAMVRARLIRDDSHDKP